MNDMRGRKERKNKYPKSGSYISLHSGKIYINKLIICNERSDDALRIYFR